MTNSDDHDRNPTPDEATGIEWWNSLTEIARGYWLAQADTAIPADAWAAFKRFQERNAARDQN